MNETYTEKQKVLITTALWVNTASVQGKKKMSKPVYGAHRYHENIKVIDLLVSPWKENVHFLL